MSALNPQPGPVPPMGPHPIPPLVTPICAHHSPFSGTCAPLWAPTPCPHPYPSAPHLCSGVRAGPHRDPRPPQGQSCQAAPCPPAPEPTPCRELRANNGFSAAPAGHPPSPCTAGTPGSRTTPRKEGQAAALPWPHRLNFGGLRSIGCVVPQRADEQAGRTEAGPQHTLRNGRLVWHLLPCNTASLCTASPPGTTALTRRGLCPGLPLRPQWQAALQILLVP